MNISKEHSYVSLMSSLDYKRRPTLHLSYYINPPPQWTRQVFTNKKLENARELLKQEIQSIKDTNKRQEAVEQYNKTHPIGKRFRILEKIKVDLDWSYRHMVYIYSRLKLLRITSDQVQDLFKQFDIEIFNYNELFLSVYVNITQCNESLDKACHLLKEASKQINDLNADIVKEASGNRSGPRYDIVVERYYVKYALGEKHSILLSMLNTFKHLNNYKVKELLDQVTQYLSFYELDFKNKHYASASVFLDSAQKHLECAKELI